DELSASSVRLIVPIWTPHRTGYSARWSGLALLVMARLRTAIRWATGNPGCAKPSGIRSRRTRARSPRRSAPREQHANTSDFHPVFGGNSWSVHASRLGSVLCLIFSPRLPLIAKLGKMLQQNGQTCPRGFLV